MSTTGLRWGDVSTQNIGATAAQLMRNGGEAIIKGFDGLTGVAKGIIDERSRVANGNALSAIMGVTDPNELNAMGQQLMQNGGPEMNKAALFEALNQQKKGLLENQSTQLSNTAQSNLNGVFATNNKNAQDNLIADTAGTIATTAGKLQDNKVGALELANRPQEIKDRNKAAEQSISMAKEKILQAQDDTRVVGKINDAKVKKDEADAEISAIDSLFRKRQNESGLLTEAQARAASRSSVANQSARLAFDKAQAKAKAGGDANQLANARLMLTYRQQYAEATAAGDTAKMAELDAKLRTAQVSATEMNSINSIFGTDRKSSNGYSEKFTPALTKELEDVNSDSSAGIQQMMGNLKNSGFMVVNPDKPGERVKLNGKGYDAFQDFIARKSRSRVGIFGVDFDDIEADDGPDYLREFANKHLKGNPDWIAKGPKPE